MATKKKVKISNYSTFLYAKQQLENELVESEMRLKKAFAEKIPFGLGNAVLQNQSGESDFKSIVKKELMAHALPLVRKFLYTGLKTNKIGLLIWGASIAGGAAIKIWASRKFLKKKG